MSQLRGAHAGYIYQDLMCAGRLVDLVLGTVIETTIDRKLVTDDRLDDLTALWADGLSERVQFKHSTDPTPLALAAFTTDSRGLLLSAVIAAAVAYRDQPDPRRRDHLFRIVVRAERPVEGPLTAAFVDADPDPGPFLPGMATHRHRFNPDVLWPDPLPVDADAAGPSREPWAFLRTGTISREDVVWFAEHTVVEVEAPEASFNLAAPAEAEQVVLRRAAEEIGAGVYPNDHRTSVDIIGAFVGAAQAARGVGPQPSVDDLLRRAQIAQDFGAVARGYVRNTAVEVIRPTVAEELAAAATASLDHSQRVVVTGAPGQGKSWASEVLAERLRGDGWLVGEHSCFLGASDLDRDDRVRAEVVFASLAAHIMRFEPELERGHRPRYASDERALASLVRSAVEAKPERPVALVVDGLDHVSRVLGARPGGRDTSTSLAQDLALLELPAGSVLVIFSQPGRHLEPLVDAQFVELPAWQGDEIATLATRLGVIRMSGAVIDTRDAPVVPADDPAARLRLVDELTARSGGNPLYATYLCRELLRSPIAHADAADALATFPAFDGNLEVYYSHLVTTLGAADVVAEILAVLDFAVTRQELGDIYPELGHRVDEAVDVLAPVLIELAGQGGIRIFHESFSRYLNGRFAANPEALAARLGQPISWLDARGLFADTRAFRFLLPMLARAGRDAEVVARIDRDFARKAISASFSAAAVGANLVVGAESAARLGDWAALVRCVELTRGAYTFESERLDSTLADYADVPIALLGPNTFAERLLFDGRTTMPSRAGLLLCLAVDRAGGTAPWGPYLDAFERERAVDRTSYGEGSNHAVLLASLHGQLRMVSADADEPEDLPLVERLTRWLDQADLRAEDVVATVIATLGARAVPEIARGVAEGKRAALALAVAEAARTGGLADIVGGSAAWAATSVACGHALGTVSRLLDLGVDVSTLPSAPREVVVEHTRELQRERSPQRDLAARWLDEIEVLADVDPLGLTAVEGVIRGPGWFACWLRFAVKLARHRAERRGGQPGGSVLDAIRVLGEDTDPFTGVPRACDLFPLEGLIADSIGRALALVANPDWAAALEVLSLVSDGTSTTLLGSVSGPLTRDELLDLVYRFTSPERSAESREIVVETVRSRGTYRHYYELAAYELSAARLALLDGDVGVAQAHWDRAATFLLGYGWRKDITIYDLLDSLPSISALDHGACCDRLSRLQPLVERVVNHTDGSETRHAPGRWWELLTVDDPEAVAWTVLREMTRRPNVPQPVYEGVRSDLWRAHQARADAVVAGALRVTLEDPSTDDDSALLDRLRPFVATSEPVRRLSEWIIARWDERASHDGSADTATDVAVDARADELNRIGASLGAHPVTAVPPGARQSATELSSWSPPLAETLSGQTLIEFRPGALGIARGIREWSHKPFKAAGPRWDLDRLVNGVGYRLVELAAVGHLEEAEAALYAVAEELPSGDESRILVSIGDGLETQGFQDLAVDAHVLAFTRSRGGGGWLTFGDREHVPSLERALELDPARARRILAAEIGRVIRGPGYRTLGVSRAMVQAFALLAGRLDAPGSEPIALSVWDAAFEVIDERLPAADAEDAPRVVYRPNDPGALAQGHGLEDTRRLFARRPDSIGTELALDGALVAAVVAGLAHPGREQKRRTLLAITLLLDHYPELVMAALAQGVRQLDVLTTAWVLEILSDRGLAAREVDTLRDGLVDLAASSFLSVRTLARRLLQGTGVDAGPTPAGTQTTDLLESEPPRGAEDDGASPERGTAALAKAVCGDPIQRVADELPGMLSQVVRRLAERLDSAEVRNLLEAQRNRLVSQADPRIPDAVTGDIQAAEEALQLVAGGARTSLALDGVIFSDPDVWDASLADGLIDEPYFALGLEAARIARPALRRPPMGEGEGWTALELADSEKVDSEAGEAKTFAHHGGPANPTAVSVGPFAGWQVLALVERRETRPRRTDASRRVSIRTAAYEVRAGSDGPSDEVPPLGYGDAALYVERLGPPLAAVDLMATQPLVGEDHGEGRRGSLAWTALGLPSPLLAPARRLVTGLGLTPSTDPYDLSLFDEVGRALVTRTWRAAYGSGEYELARPSIWGCDVLLRGDLFESLRRLSGPLVWREHAVVLELV